MYFDKQIAHYLILCKNKNVKANQNYFVKKIERHSKNMEKKNYFFL